MKSIKIFTAICLITMAAIFLNACSKDSPYSSGGGNPTGSNAIAIQSTQFSPSTITLVAGSTVTWTNTDTGAHTVTSDDGTSFDSGNINPGATYSFTFTAPGSYAYHCSIHPSMKGTVQIVIK